MRRILFLCSQDRRRTPRAEQVFSTARDAEVASAGLDHDADIACTPKLFEPADVVFVMESRTGAGCPDNYASMQPGHVRLLHDRVDRHLRRRPKPPQTPR